MNAILIMDDGVDMKIMKIGYVLLIAIAAFLALPAHGADLDSADLYNCVKLDNEMIVHYNCKEPATVAFCFENIVMKQNAAEVDIEFARDLHCQARSGFHDPCFFYGSVRKCGNIRGQAWANRIATYTVVYGVCARAGNVPRWVSNPGSNGRYTCDSDPMEGSESDDGSAETLSEDDQYERLFGEYENRLSELLDGDLSSAENLGTMLVESLGGELSFDDVLGNFGMGQRESGDQGKEQTESGDQGTEQVASGDQESKQSSLSASDADQILPSPEICVEMEEVIHTNSFGDESRMVVITNGCPAPVLILYMDREIYGTGDMDMWHTVTPVVSTMSTWQGLSFEERIRETYEITIAEGEECKAPYPNNPILVDCFTTDVVQPGYVMTRGHVDINKGFEWVACAQYHPLSLDAASGPRECDVNPAFFMPNTDEAWSSLCSPPWGPGPGVTLERCFRGR